MRDEIQMTWLCPFGFPWSTGGQIYKTSYDKLMTMLRHGRFTTDLR